MKSLLRDTFHLSLYVGLLSLNVWFLAFSYAPLWYLPIGIVLQGFMFVGTMEAFHQAVHMNLHPWRSFNIFLGRLTGAHLGLGFQAYRRFHITHHSTTNTPCDPEKAFYESPASVFGMFAFPFVYLFRNANVINRGTYLRPEEVSLHRKEIASTFLFRIGTLAVTYLYPLQMLLAYWLPYLVFFYVELFLSQSQHYLSTERERAPRGDEHYAEGVNVRLPWPLDYLSLYTNLHATHHVKASIKWYETPSMTRRDAHRIVSIGFFQFLHACLTKGPRSWRQAAVENQTVVLVR